MTSAGCARGITISGALGTVRAHGEYNYRTTFAFRILPTPTTTDKTEEIPASFLVRETSFAR